MQLLRKKKSEKRTLNDVKSPSWLCKRYCNCKFPQNIHTRSDTNRYRYPLYYTVHSAPEQHHIHVYHLSVCKYLNIILYIRLWLTKVFLMQRTVVPPAMMHSATKIPTKDDEYQCITTESRVFYKNLSSQPFGV